MDVCEFYVFKSASWLLGYEFADDSRQPELKEKPQTSCTEIGAA